MPFPSFLLPLFIDHRRILQLDASLRERRLCYYARDGYRSVGERLDAWFPAGLETEPAQMRPNHFYRSLLGGKKAMRISGWLEQGPADLILLTDGDRVVRGLGDFAADSQPFPAAEGGFFVAFAPVPEPGRGYQIWAVRRREARRVIPTALFPDPTGARIPPNPGSRGAPP